MNRQSFTTNRCAARSRPRSGFTLIELMVVIVVIAILISLLLPAIGNVRARARDAQVRSEISQLETAISQFKQRFQMDPPSRIVLYETPAGWAGDPTNRALVRQLWPQFDFSADHDIDHNGSASGSHTLTGGECLVFFLGGILTDSPSIPLNRRAATGFSKNPMRPFDQGGNREGPFFEFDPGRFSDVNPTPNNFPEYLDPLPGQSVPYLYYSSYDGAGYRTSGTSNEFTGGGYLQSPYRIGTSGTSEPYKSKSYQIISPGPDREFGPGGPFVPSDNSSPLPGYLHSDGSTTIPASARTVEYDNITNFHSGRLKP